MSGRGRPRLVATDLDGTLLRSDGTVSARTRAALAACAAAGLPVVAVTARPVRVAREIVTDLGLHHEAVCLGGSQRYDTVAQELVQDVRLDDDAAARIVEAVREAEPDTIVVAEVGLEIHVEEHFSLAGWGFADVPGHTVRRSLAVLGGGVSGLLIGHDATSLDDLEVIAAQAAGEHASVTRSGGPHLEVFAPGVSKAAALSALCAELGIEAADVLAFGDERNDRTMLAWAGRSVAVANAWAVLREEASEVCAANDADGVAQVLEQLL